MGRPLRIEVSMAYQELRRFLAYQYNEALRLGYPRMSIFAKDIARGTLSAAPPTEEDPIMEAVGKFYWSLAEIDRLIVANRFFGAGTEKLLAIRTGNSIGSYRLKFDRVLERCAGFLQGRGFY